MRPLGSGRQILNWLGVQFADDQPVSREQKLAQKIFAVIFAMAFITIATLNIVMFVKLRLTNPEEFFFVLMQFAMFIHAWASFITLYSYSARISAVFQYLTEIYEKCKQIVWLIDFFKLKKK